MFKLIKAIKLQRSLRIRQEVLCHHVVTWTWQRPYPKDDSPFFNEFCSVNKGAHNVNNKLPYLYFLLSDIFGGAYSLKKKSKKIIDSIKK